MSRGYGALQRRIIEVLREELESGELLFPVLIVRHPLARPQMALTATEVARRVFGPAAEGPPESALRNVRRALGRLHEVDPNVCRVEGDTGGTGGYQATYYGRRWRWVEAEEKAEMLAELEAANRVRRWDDWHAGARRRHEEHWERMAAAPTA